MRPPRKLAGNRRQFQVIQGLRDDLEWERQKAIIAALLPYSGDRRRPPRFPALPPGAIPRQRKPSEFLYWRRKPLPTEQVLVEKARERAYPHLVREHGRSDIDNNRGGRA